MCKVIVLLKKALYLSVNVFSTKVLIGDAIFKSPNGDGTGTYNVRGEQLFGTYFLLTLQEVLSVSNTTF